MSVYDFPPSKELMIQEVFQVEMNLFRDKQNQQNKLFGSNVIHFIRNINRKNFKKRVIINTTTNLMTKINNNYELLANICVLHWVQI